MKAPPGASIDERLKVIEDSVARAEDCIAAVEAAANRSVEALRASLTELIDASRAEVGHLRSTLEALPVGALDFELVGTPDQSAESPEQQRGDPHQQREERRRQSGDPRREWRDWRERGVGSF
jgi:hypothetical protein